MRFLEWFRKKKQPASAATVRTGEAPTHLAHVHEAVSDDTPQEAFEWRGRLVSEQGGRTFHIRYFGARHPEESALIVGTEAAPMLVEAVDVASGAVVVLFDGCRHGFNALLCDTYPPGVVNGRHATQHYRDPSGADRFEVLLSVYRQIDYDDEYGDDADEEGMLETADGSRITLAQLKRDGFDVIRIFVLNAQGTRTEIVSEELA